MAKKTIIIELGTDFGCEMSEEDRISWCDFVDTHIEPFFPAETHTVSVSLGSNPDDYVFALCVEESEVRNAIRSLWGDWCETNPANNADP